MKNLKDGKIFDFGCLELFIAFCGGIAANVVDEPPSKSTMHFVDEDGGIVNGVGATRVILKDIN